MKKGKYLIGIIIICIVVFIGIEFFRKDEHQDIDNNIENNATNNVNTIQENGENNTVIEENSTTEPTQAIPVEEIKDGQELLKKAEKTLTARGWAGASNNIIGIKEGIIYYYNKGTGEFRKIATGIEDIYYKTEDSEEITAKKGNNTEEFGEMPKFLVFE